MTDYREDIKWAVYIHIVPKAISGYDWDMNQMYMKKMENIIY